MAASILLEPVDGSAVILISGMSLGESCVHFTLRDGTTRQYLGPEGWSRASRFLPASVERVAEDLQLTIAAHTARLIRPGGALILEEIGTGIHERLEWPAPPTPPETSVSPQDVAPPPADNTGVVAAGRPRPRLPWLGIAVLIGFLAGWPAFRILAPALTAPTSPPLATLEPTPDIPSLEAAQARAAAAEAKVTTLSAEIEQLRREPVAPSVPPPPVPAPEPVPPQNGELTRANTSLRELATQLADTQTLLQTAQRAASSADDEVRRLTRDNEALKEAHQARLSAPNLAADPPDATVSRLAFLERQRNALAAKIREHLSTIERLNTQHDIDQREIVSLRTTPRPAPLSPPVRVRTVFGAAAMAPRGAIFTASNELTEKAAADAAKATCVMKSRVGAECPIVHQFHNTCFSVARGVGGRGWAPGVGLPEEQAEARALARCAADADGPCEIKFTVCSPDQIRTREP